MNDEGDLMAGEYTDSGVYVAKLVPTKILDELQISAIGSALAEVIDDGARKLVIDFAKVDHLSSSALGMLITVRQRLSDVKGAMRLCNICTDIYQIFKITGLDKLFAIYPTGTEALAGFEE